jgi:hypothetical protein
MSSVRSHDRDGQGIVTAASPREHLTDRPADAYALLEMHAAMSPDNSYLRFFNYSRLSAEHEAERLCLGDTGRGAKPGQVALLALAGAGRRPGLSSLSRRHLPRRASEDPGCVPGPSREHAGPCARA